MADCTGCIRDFFTMDEMPQHKVYLDAFWIDRTEVTNARYAAFLNTSGNQEEGGTTWLDTDSEYCRIEQDGDEFRPEEGYGDHPVIEVSWYGAAAYCEWAGRRLPTEAQWEKAARGTDGRMYPWGQQIASCEYAVLREDDEGCGKGRTWPVGSKPKGASPYGALDMTGNVWEWVADYYDDDYYDNSPSVNPEGPPLEEDPHRGLRGGGWSHTWELGRSAARSHEAAHRSGGDTGFRCVRLR